VDVCGTHELLANALIMEGEIERTQDLRLEDLPGRGEQEEQVEQEEGE